MKEHLDRSLLERAIRTLKIYASEEWENTPVKYDVTTNNNN